MTEVDRPFKLEEVRLVIYLYLVLSAVPLWVGVSVNYLIGCLVS